MWIFIGVAADNYWLLYKIFSGSFYQSIHGIFERLYNDKYIHEKQTLQITPFRAMSFS